MLELISGSVTGEMPNIGNLVICTVFSLIFGLGVASIHMFRNKYSKSMALTLALLPAIVQVVIMLVNGNIGVGIAVAGAFSLVRFRSIPGKARDIVSLFFAMAMGFVVGMGYIFYAFIFFILIGGMSMLLVCVKFGQKEANNRVLRITIPENLDYDELFDDVLDKYAANFELDKVRTTNMGSMYELTYLIQLKTASVPKSFIDELRCRNGNLGILISREQNEGWGEL